MSTERTPWWKVPWRWVRPVVDRVMATWAGRILLRTGTTFLRLELLDRAMTLAAQLFTSVFPLLILAAVVFGQRFDEQIADAVSMPEGTRQVLDEALRSGGFSAFGLLGALIVLVSSTSLARTMARAFTTIWQLPRPRRGIRSAWRLLAAVLLLAASVVLGRLLTFFGGRFPVSHLLVTILMFLMDTALAVAVPWILLAHALPTRLLVPGGMIFGALMLVVRPAGLIYLPHALQVSADRYGTIGLAFTYIGWLYVLSLCYLGAAMAGQVLTHDEGRLGRLLRAGAELPVPAETGDDDDKEVYEEPLPGIPVSEK